MLDKVTTVLLDEFCRVSTNEPGHWIRTVITEFIQRKDWINETTAIFWEHKTTALGIPIYTNLTDETELLAFVARVIDIAATQSIISHIDKGPALGATGRLSRISRLFERYLSHLIVGASASVDLGPGSRVFVFLVLLALYAQVTKSPLPDIAVVLAEEPVVPGDTGIVPSGRPFTGERATYYVYVTGVRVVTTSGNLRYILWTTSTAPDKLTVVCTTDSHISEFVFATQGPVERVVKLAYAQTVYFYVVATGAHYILSTDVTSGPGAYSTRETSPLDWIGALDDIFDMTVTESRFCGHLRASRTLADFWLLDLSAFASIARDPTILAKRDLQHRFTSEERELEIERRGLAPTNKLVASEKEAIYDKYAYYIFRAGEMPTRPDWLKSADQTWLTAEGRAYVEQSRAARRKKHDHISELPHPGRSPVLDKRVVFPHSIDHTTVRAVRLIQISDMPNTRELYDFVLVLHVVGDVYTLTIVRLDSGGGVTAPHTTYPLELTHPLPARTIQDLVCRFIPGTFMLYIEVALSGDTGHMRPVFRTSLRFEHYIFSPIKKYRVLHKPDTGQPTLFSRLQGSSYSVLDQPDPRAGGYTRIAYRYYDEGAHNYPDKYVHVIFIWIAESQVIASDVAIPASLIYHIDAFVPFFRTTDTEGSGLVYIRGQRYVPAVADDDDDDDDMTDISVPRLVPVLLKLTEISSPTAPSHLGATVNQSGGKARQCHACRRMPPLYVHDDDDGHFYCTPLCRYMTASACRRAGYIEVKPEPRGH